MGYYSHSSQWAKLPLADGCFSANLSLMAARIALFGGSFNPPGLHHRALVEALARSFDLVLVVPCGPRPDKLVTNSVPAVFRAALADITFGDLAGVEVDLFDLERDVFTRAVHLQERYADRGEVWHVVGTDLIKGGASGDSEIQRSWERGAWLWENARFLVLDRPGHEWKKEDLPPCCEVMEVDIPGASSDIRSAMARGEDVSAAVTPRALTYMLRYGLYRAPAPNTWARGSLSGLRGFHYTDARNPTALHLSQKFQPCAAASVQAADFITALGGDGIMLRAIREHWRSRLPYCGVNAGHLGFLMNSQRMMLEEPFPPADVIFRQMPMLYVEAETGDGQVHSVYGFNDAWVERTTSQSAWLEVKVNGIPRLEKLVCDGALVATAAGSTAYARSMGAPPLLADTPAWLIVGSNVMEPFNWKSALLSVDSSVEMRSIAPDKRPIEAFVDGLSLGPVVALRARLSRAAAAELVFHAGHDMAEKISAVQFGHGMQK
jgi:NAD+ kinase